MLPRALRLALPCALASALAFAAPRAFADDGASDEDPNRLRGPRVGFVPGVGAGLRAFTGAPPYYPSFIGLTVSQLEITVEGEKLGGFVRGAFFSSGNDGRWTAPVIALGGQYRLIGDGEERPAFLVRAGLVYERWHANSGGCPVPFFFPDNCKTFTPPTLSGHIDVVAPQYQTTIDTFGALGGVRLELPVQTFYLAFGGELSSTVDVSKAAPGLVLGGQLTFSFAFRNHQSGNDSSFRATTPTRYRERGK